MPSGPSTLLVLWLLVLGGECRCGERLERALDLMQQRGSSARRRYDSEDADTVYHERLRSAPIDVTVTKVVVEIPHGPSSSGATANGRDAAGWATVERCAYEPSSNSVRTRVAFNELAVTGLVQLVVREPDSPPGARADRHLPAESCRMSLRLRRAGMDFYTSPIARGRGQMRIRTESSFLEPRFASIYAYGCRAAVAPQVAQTSYDRVESEPRKRELDKDVLSVSAFARDIAWRRQEEDLIKEENRLGASVAATPLGFSNDALLDSLWRSRADIAREMEDVFLRSASQAITHYIERQLHPAIKETLMLSMGFTISYG
ncbi:uncharacterized protein LOC131665860 [Phymastichus coffea]|uniref:uncharacterized protein LOC131665860 n=1 Tax=Phymastichus coffea TaxID=108790 RepID=UPI00273BB981|nr:uncharacterized protein LOC131665860 [Phymastichus coffea]